MAVIKAQDFATGTWTPTYTPGSGTFTGHTITLNSATYLRMGPVVWCQFDVTIVAIGSGTPAGIFTVSLPFTSAVRGFMNGFEQAVTNTGIQGKISSGTAAIDVTFLDGSTVIGNGKRVVTEMFGVTV